MALIEKLKAFAEKNKDLFAKHKVKLEIEEPVKPKEFLASGKLKDGSEIHTTSDSFKEGADCYFKDAEGNETAVPNGTYELESGEKITVTEGIVTAVESGAPADEEMGKVVSELKKIYEEELAAVKSELEKEKTELAKVKTELSAMTDKATKAEAKAVELGKQLPPKKDIKKDDLKKEEPAKPIGHQNPLTDKVMQGIREAREKAAAN